MENPSRITMNSIFGSLLAVFNFEKGLSYTIKSLLLNPGKTLRNYLFTSDRSKHIRPMNFLLLMITIATFLTLQFIKSTNPELVTGNDYNDVVSGSSISLGDDIPQKVKDAIGIFNTFVTQYFHLFQLLKIPFFALATFWLFRKKDYYYAEHLIINSYIIGLTTFLFIVAFPALLVSSSIFAMLIAASTIYMFIAFILVFEEPTIKGVLKAVGSYFLATILHVLAIAIAVGAIFIAM